jgi:hypothetical protein
VRTQKPRTASFEFDERLLGMGKANSPAAV